MLADRSRWYSGGNPIHAHDVTPIQGFGMVNGGGVHPGLADRAFPFCPCRAFRSGANTAAIAGSRFRGLQARYVAARSGNPGGGRHQKQIPPPIRPNTDLPLPIIPATPFRTDSPRTPGWILHAYAFMGAGRAFRRLTSNSPTTKTISAMNHNSPATSFWLARFERPDARRGLESSLFPARVQSREGT